MAINVISESKKSNMPGQSNAENSKKIEREATARELAVLSMHTSKMLLNVHDHSSLRMYDHGESESESTMVPDCCIASPKLPVFKKVDLDWILLPKSDTGVKVGKVKQMVQMYGLGDKKVFGPR